MELYIIHQLVLINCSLFRTLLLIISWLIKSGKKQLSHSAGVTFCVNVRVM